MNRIFPNTNAFTADKNRQKRSVGLTVPQSRDLQNSPSPLNPCKKAAVNFTGLNRTLSKIAYESAESIKAEVANFPNSKGLVGNLPAEWVQLMPKETRSTAIKGLYGDLKTIVADFRNNVFFDTNTTEKFDEAFAKAGILTNGEKIKIEHLDDGFYGCAFRLKGVSDDKYIIKIFKSNNEINNYHGNYIEPNRAAFWQKHAGKKTQMVPFYFADIDAGYMVNKYIDKNTPKFKKKIAPEVFGLKSADICDGKTGKNVINGFQIDYGGIKITERNAKTSKAKWPKKPKQKHQKNIIQNLGQKFINMFRRKKIEE